MQKNLLRRPDSDITGVVHPVDAVGKQLIQGDFYPSRRPAGWCLSRKNLSRR